MNITSENIRLAVSIFAILTGALMFYTYWQGTHVPKRRRNK